MRRAFSVGIVLALSSVAATFAAVVVFLTPEIPNYSQVRLHYRPSYARVRSRNGEVLQQVRIERYYRADPWLELKHIPKDVVETIVSSEDRRFYSHVGVDAKALLRAAWMSLWHNKRSGASTLSMQLVRLLNEGSTPFKSPWPHASAPRLSKLSQILGALLLDSTWSKAEILEAYLNLVPFRGELRGISAASQILFHTAPEALTPAHGLLLAAILPAPNAAHALIETRACKISQNLAFQTKFPTGCDILPKLWGERALAHLTLYDSSEPILSKAAALRILKGAGKHSGSSPKRVPLELTSTIEREIQTTVAALTRSHLEPLRARRALDAAVLVVHNQSGEVRAYLPNSGTSASAPHVDGILAYRQAGSTLKPFIYGSAFELNLLSPDSVLSDMPLELSVFSGLYKPANYDRRFRGPVSAKVALASSLNIPALRVLTIVGLKNATSTLSKLQLLKPGADDRYGYSIALGAPVVRLWDLVNAYRTIANDGEYSDLTVQPSPKNRPQESSASEHIFSSKTTAALKEILSSRDARRETFGLESPLATSYWSAVKTGTSKDMTDNWCVGFSNDYTVGVWVGNFSGEPMHNVSGVSGAAPLWSSVLEWLHENRSSTLHAANILAIGDPLPLSPMHTRPSRITAPTSGTSIAIDPGIPLQHQSVNFTAQTGLTNARWSLNGSVLGPVAAPTWWQPTKGAHTLTLVDNLGNEVDRSEFSVR